MSRFFSSRLSSLTPYTPGEQPKDAQYIKLNTNESPFPPSPLAVAKASEAAKQLNLYPDPTCSQLCEVFASQKGIAKDEVIFGNGSDEILFYAFQAFCDENTPALFADITYGFYEVFAQLCQVPYEKIPLRDDFSIAPEDYFGQKKTIFLANPNAPTGMILQKSEIEKILQNNPENIVVVDEAYIDFGGESCCDLIARYDNLLVVQTFSKSRSMAGARLGMGMANRALIADLNTVKYSTNPYNINKMTMAAGIATMQDESYTQKNCQTIIENRAFTVAELNRLGFFVLPSKTNFVFAAHDKIDGATLYQKLKEKNILVRHFTNARIANFNRITIGTKEQMQALICAISQILEETT